MAQTTTNPNNIADPYVPGSRRAWVGTVTVGDNYTTGGVSIPASLFGMTSLDTVVGSSTDTTGRYTLAFNNTTGNTARIFDAGATNNAELANASSASAGLVFPGVYVIGI